VTVLVIDRAGPLCTVQDAGRPGQLRHGVSASGPMDRAGFARAAGWLGGAGAAGIEFTMAGIGFTLESGSLGVGCDGGDFGLRRNGAPQGWPARLALQAGDRVDIVPGAAGNYGYLRFDRELALPPVLGSLATNSVVGLGGLEGRPLRPGDRLRFGAAQMPGQGTKPQPSPPLDGPIRIIWGLHADLFPPAVRKRFIAAEFTVSPRLDRMGARLVAPPDVFAAAPLLSLVSDAIVPGDIQILGDGTPIVLLRDHQPTGGYPRLATVISADLDRFVQLRPGAIVRFEPVTLARAHAMLARS
jgi:biotin-dependent carboxylase-like uncharacterized protein